MRRKLTRVTVWPAIADLMTAIMVISVLSGMILVALNYKSDDQPETEDLAQDLKIQVDSLQVVIEEKEQQLESLQDSIQSIHDDQGKIGSRSCLGKQGPNRPYSLLTITFNLKNYQIGLNKPQVDSASRELQDYVRPYNQRMLRESEMIAFAKGLYQLGREYTEGGCNFFVRATADGRIPKSKWYDSLGDYLRLANPWVLQ